MSLSLQKQPELFLKTNCQKKKPKLIVHQSSYVMEFSGTKLIREFYGRNDVASPVKYLGPYFHVSIELLLCYRKRPDQTWVQCDSCLKWRKLPDGIDQLPEKWYCSNNPDPQFRYHIVGSTLFWKGRKYCSRCMNRRW